MNPGEDAAEIYPKNGMEWLQTHSFLIQLESFLQSALDDAQVAQVVQNSWGFLLFDSNLALGRR